MDVGAIGSLSTALSGSQTADAVQMAVLKKTMDIQEQSAMQLLQTLPAMPSNPAHLGNNVDTFA